MRGRGRLEPLVARGTAGKSPGDAAARRRLNVFALLTISGHSGLAVLSAASGHGTSALVSVATMIALVGLYLRPPRPVAAAGHALLLVTLAATVVVHLGEGLVSPLAIVFYGFLPLVAGYLMGARAAVQWAVAVLVVAMLLRVGSETIDFPRQGSSRGSGDVVAGEFLFLLFLGLFAVAAGRTQSRYAAAMERIVRLTEARREAVLTAIPDVVLRVDKHGAIVEAHRPHDERAYAALALPHGCGSVDDLPQALATPLHRALDEVRDMPAEPVFEFTVPAPVNGAGSLEDPMTFEARVVPSEADERLVLIRDVTERVRLRHRLEHQARHDPLTGLPNRHVLPELISEALDEMRRDGQPVAVLFLDLDNFKAVNDSLGHTFGDQLLAEVAGRLRSVCGEDVVRFGGDEFVYVTVVDDSDQALGCADTVLHRLCEPYVWGDLDLQLRASIGVRVATGPADTAEALVRDADTAMYAAKGSTTTRVVLFDAQLRDQVLAVLDVERALAGAVERNELALLYQPIVELGTARTAGCEALVRWHRPGHGLVPPDLFIPVAERSGAIVPLGEWVLHTACAQLAAFAAAGHHDIEMSVNVSARQIDHPDFVEGVERALRDHDLDSNRVKLELTETAILDDLDSYLPVLDRLHDIGVAVSLDDFGTGYSSLSQLRRLPIDTIKIDRSFTCNVAASPWDRALVRSITDLARARGLSVVAEGVETPEQLCILQQNGCAYGQGYLLGRPCSGDTMLDLLRPRQAPAAPSVR